MSVVNDVGYEILGPWPAHGDYVRSFVYFGDPHYKIVSASDDRRIMIWDSETYKNLDQITEHKNYIFHMIKWDDETFMTGSWDKTINSYSIIPPYKLVKKFDFFKGDIMQLMKINDDLLLSCDTCNSIFIISYTKSEIVRKLRPRKIRLLKNLVLSKLQPHSFYLNEDDTKKNLKLIDFEQDLDLKEFRSHKNHLLTFRTLLRKQNSEEVIICGGYEGKVYVYVNSKNSSTEAVKVFYVNKNHSLYSLLLIRQKYLFVGDRTGILHIYEIDASEKEVSFNVKSKIQVFDDSSVRCLGLKKITGSSGLSLCAGSDSGIFCAVNIKSGLCIPESMSKFEKEDLESRVSFLKTCQDSYVFSEMEKRRMLVKIVLLKNNRRVNNLLRILLSKN